MKKNLALTGMMGVGKSTIGKSLSNHLSMDFVDIDRIIEKKLKLTIQNIFKQKGEIFFRKLEEVEFSGVFIMQAYRDDEGVDVFNKQLEFIKVILQKYNFI